METINYSIESKEELAFACMPIIKNGGMFLKISSNYVIGTYVTVAVKLLDDPNPLSFQGKIVWITPKNEQNQMPEGVGVQFSEEYAEKARNAIESIMPDAFAIDRKNVFF